MVTHKWAVLNVGSKGEKLIHTGEFKTKIVHEYYSYQYFQNVTYSFVRGKKNSYMCQPIVSDN